MTRKPVAIGPETTLGETERIFEEHDFDALPAIEAGGRLVGVVARGDVLQGLRRAAKEKSPAES